MDRNARIVWERSRRVRPGQRAVFFMRDGVEWIRIESPHDRTSTPERPASDDDRERFAAFRTDPSPGAP